MAFFNSEYAALLQYITFPLEVIGLTLATIEVRFGVLTERINQMLQAQVQHWETAKVELREKHPFLYKLHGGNSGFHMPVPYSMYMLLTAMLAGLAVSVVMVFALVLMVKTGFIDQGTAALYSDWNDRFMFYLLVPFSSVTIFGLGIIFVAVKFVANRAVGTLGIIIAGVGLSGEAYQVVTQLVLR